jgi:hypothetical protein
LYLAGTTQVSALIYLAGAANCCATAMDTRDGQVPGVENLSYLVGGLVDGEDVSGGLGSVPASQPLTVLPAAVFEVPGR